MKPREINLYKWKLVLKSNKCVIMDDYYIIDRGDNKRRSTAFLKSQLMKMTDSDLPSEMLTIGGFAPFRGYAISYNLTP